MYGKLFASMYEGSLYGNWQALVTLQQMVILCDPHGTLDMTPQALAARTSIPLEIIHEGIRLLEQPDEYSRSSEDEGRRIVRIDATRPWGWRIVNYAYYRQLASAEEKRRKDRERIAEKRQNATSRDMSQGVADVAHAEAEAEGKVEADPPQKTSSSSEGEVGANAPAAATRKARATRIPEGWRPTAELAAYAEKELPNVDVERLAEEFADYWRARAGEKARKLDWDATWRTWVRRSADRYPTKRGMSLAPKPKREPTEAEVAEARRAAIEANQRELARKIGGAVRAIP